MEEIYRTRWLAFLSAKDTVIFGCQVVSMARDGSSCPLGLQSSLAVKWCPWDGMARSSMSPHPAFPGRSEYVCIKAPWFPSLRHAMRLLSPGKHSRSAYVTQLSFLMLLTWGLFAVCASSFVEKRAEHPSVSEIHQELSHHLSDGTEIYFPFDSEYANYTTRWNEAVATYPTVVVVPATKEDVAITVRTSLRCDDQCANISQGPVRERH